VSENENCHCTGTAKVPLKVTGRNAWKGKESVEVTSENRHRGCGRDMLGQTVPSTGSSNREGPITDGQLTTATKQSEGIFRPQKIGRALQLIGKVRWCCPKQTIVT